MGNKELVVSALENGTVLDHIPAENVYKALSILSQGLQYLTLVASTKLIEANHKG